jgi:hypothetical protein
MSNITGSFRLSTTTLWNKHYELTILGGRLANLNRARSNPNYGEGTIGVGIGIDKTNGKLTPIPIPTPTPMTQSPHN